MGCECGCNSCGPYKSLIFESDPTLGIDWGNVLGQVGGAAAQTGLSWLLAGGPRPSQALGCGQVRLTRDGDIALCLDYVGQQRNMYLATPGLTTAERLAAIEQWYAFISNPNFFDQTASPHYLGNELQIAQRDIQQLRQRLADELRQGGATVDPATGQIVATAGIVPGLDNSTLLILGGGFVLMLLLLRQ